MSDAPRIPAAAFLSMLGGTLELRAPRCPERRGGTFTSTASGYFNDLVIAAEAALSLDRNNQPPGIYVTLNPVRPDLLGRSCNKVTFKARSTTSDAEVTERRWLLIDVDPARPAGLSATDAEMNAALDLARAIRDTMEGEGWPLPVLCMSGNGAYLLWRIDLPNSEEATDLIKRVLHGFAARFDTDGATVDRSTFNPSRIIKVIGTTARKGDNLTGVDGVEDRPHRVTWFESPDGELSPVPVDLLEGIAAEPKAAPSPAADRQATTGGGSSAVHRCRAYLGKCPDALSGRNGHGSTLRAAAECYRFGLSDGEARETMAWFNDRKTGGERWSEREIEHKMKDARAKVEADGEIGVRLRSGSAAPPADCDAVAPDKAQGSAGAKPRKGGDGGKSSKPRRFIMRRGDDIDDAGNHYLWQRRIPLGAPTVIFSRPGRGKSTMGAYFAGIVTNGGRWPDGTPCPQGTVLYIKGEGTDAAIRDRMKAAGADGSKYVVIGRADDEDAPMIDLAVDADCLNAALDELPDARVIIVDTLDSVFPSMRMIDNANIRKCLWPLQEIAEARDIAVVIFAHTNKGGYADPLDRLSGGRAIGGAARAIWYLGKTDPDAEECHMASVKCNDFVPAKTLEYKIRSMSLDTPGAIHWGEECDVTAWELDGPQRGSGGGGGGAKADECEQWLSELLAEGPRPTREVNLAAAGLEYGGFVMKKAKDALGTSTKAAKGTFPPVYYVCLPDQSPPNLSPVKEDEPGDANAEGDPPADENDKNPHPPMSGDGGEPSPLDAATPPDSSPSPGIAGGPGGNLEGLLEAHTPAGGSPMEKGW